VGGEAGSFGGHSNRMMTDPWSFFAVYHLSMI
jgi:hypothetical protein